MKRSPNRGRGECRVPNAPAASRAKLSEAHERSHHRSTGNHPAFPHAMVLRLISCSPRRRIRLVTVICGLKVCPSPVGPTRLRKFSTSNGCQNHTALPSAKSAVRLRAIRQLTGLNRPALPSPDIARRCRVHRIPPRVRDDRDTPLMWDRTVRDLEVIWVRREGKYFCKWGWTGF